MKITDAIYKLDNIKGANCYLYKSDKGEISIIDTGLHGNEKIIAAELKKIGISLSQINYILLTHSDVDHIGSALELKNMTDAKIAIHSSDVPFLEGKMEKKKKGFIGLILGIINKLFKTPKFSPDIILNENDIIGGLNVIHIPGHSEGSAGFYIPEKVLFSGDALITNGKSEIKGIMEIFTPDVAAAKLSIKKIAGLNYAVLMPGHGSPVIGDASNKVRKFADKYC